MRSYDARIARKLAGRVCANPKCKDDLAPFTRLPLCKSCRWMAEVVSLAIGSLLGLARLLELTHAHGWF